MSRHSLIAVLVLGAVSGTFASAAEQEKASDRCALCHEQETKEWLASPHARTINDSFLGVWEKEGKKLECLVCHTSQIDRKTGEFSRDGVSCESCHGTISPDHPGEGNKAKLPVTSEVCQSCHSVTFGEWRISAHGQKNIRCIDCHKMHHMELRKEDPDQMCGSCHTERLKSFSHATHASKGLHCISCHMPEVMNGGLKIKGAGLRGHTFGVGAETCANCHREMVHSGGELATLQQEVQQLKLAAPETLQKQLATAQDDAAKLRESVQANRRVFAPLIGLSFLLGAFFGFAIPLVRRNRSGGAAK
jgi:hypothetical protein